MLSKSLVLLGAAALAVNAATVPNEVAIMKRNILDRLAARRVAKRDTSVTSGVDDATILNFALTLEHLENVFYAEALAKFDDGAFRDAGFNGGYALLQKVAADEAAHVDFLTTALTAAGATPVQACNYTFPYEDVNGFLGLSQVIEGVGVSAYLGAAGAINASDYVTAAGSILTVEARHNAFISYLNKYSPFPAPFDTPLSATSVVTLVAPFFGACPEGSAPTITGHPALNLTEATPTLNSTINVTPANASVATAFTGTVYCGFASGLQSAFSEWTNGSCTVPSQNITSGQTYVLLTSGPSVGDASVLAGPAIALIGEANTTVSIPNASGSGSSGSNGSGNSSSAMKTAVASLALMVAGVAVFLI